MFGDPTPPLKDAVESGVYHPDPKLAPFAPEVGDVLLAYCTGSYEKYPMRCPGIGIVLGKTDDHITYRYLPLKQPVYKDDFERSLNQDEQRKFQQKRFPVNWLFEISKSSFAKALADATIDWP
jgi:hypothetical protein